MLGRYVECQGLTSRLRAPEEMTIAGLAAAAGASRGGMVVFGYVSRPIGDGLGKGFCRGLRRPDVAIAALQLAALPFLCRMAAGASALCVNALAILGARAYFHKRAGGITGDWIGAMCQITES
jgi:cobalamin synthase